MLVSYLARYGMPDFNCDGSCEHHNKKRDPWDQLSPCGAHCFPKHDLRYSGRDTNAVKCDGECRFFQGKEIRKISSRKTCNGVCLRGDGDEPWFSQEEWCNGVTECDDATDEANCKICPEIKR